MQKKKRQKKEKKVIKNNKSLKYSSIDENIIFPIPCVFEAFSIKERAESEAVYNIDATSYICCTILNTEVHAETGIFSLENWYLKVELLIRISTQNHSQYFS